MQWFAHLALMPNGRVFHGGPGQTFHTFDPMGGGANDVLGQPVGDRARMWGNAVTYDVGKDLMVGGNTVAKLFSDEGSVYAAEIYNPDTNQRAAQFREHVELAGDAAD